MNETESSKSIFNVNGSEIIGQSSGRLALRSAYRTTKASQTRSHSFSERGLLISGNPARNASAIVSTDHGFPFVRPIRSEEHTSELQSLMRTSYAVFCLKKNNTTHTDSSGTLKVRSQMFV